MRRALAILLPALLVPVPVLAQYGQPASVGLNLGGPAGEFLSVPTTTDIQGNSSYTLEAWVYPLSYTNYPTIIGNDYRSSFWLGLNQSGNVRFYPTGGALNYVESAAVVPLNAWTHVAATYVQGVGWSIYLNGQLASTGVGILGAPGVNGADLRIGADREGGSPDYLWNGYLDEVRIWSVARTGPQIRSTMYVDVGKPTFATPAYTGLQAVWDFHLPSITGAFDRCTGSGRADNFALFEPGPILSNAFVAPVSPNVGVYMNGTDDYAVLPMGDGFTDGLTIDAWVAPTSYDGFPTIAGRGFATSFWLGLSTTGKLRFYPTGGSYVQSDGVIPQDKWTHVAATYHDGRTTFYVNGELDSQTGAISGPVGENGAEVHVGADNPISYFWQGYLDEVRVTRGEMNPLQVRASMFRGYSGYISPLTVSVADGDAEQWREDFDGFQVLDVHGSGAHLVRSGAALSSPSWAPASAPVSEFHRNMVGGFYLPDGDVALGVAAPIDVPEDVVVNDVDVFVFAPTGDLSQMVVTLQSPAMTTIDLVSAGAGRGRDLHTVFNDGAINTLATGVIPYTAGVQPSQPLATFNGESSQGTWTIDISSLGLTTVDLWAWGIRINGLAVGVEPGTAPLAASLRLEGAHPVRGQGGMVFQVPRAADVSLELMDVQGRRVRTLYRARSEPGATHLRWRTAGLAPGVYFALLRLDGAIGARRRVVVEE